MADSGWFERARPDRAYVRRFALDLTYSTAAQVDTGASARAPWTIRHPRSAIRFPLTNHAF